MGEVYKARDTRLDRLVALKVLSSVIALSGTARERFEREARRL
jgi:serine/threonine protein kinase